jgi:hypothetical protein
LLRLLTAAFGTSQPWQLPGRTAGHGSKADSEVPRITRELRLLTFEYPDERYAWPREFGFEAPDLWLG